MINQTAERVWHGALLVLNPTCLVDRLLDRLDELGAAIMPAYDDARSRQLARVEVRLD